MAMPNGESMWKLSLGLIALLFFFCIGIAHALNPDRFVKPSGMRKGGKMLAQINRDGTRVVGVICAAFSGALIYLLLRDVFAK